MKKSALLLKRPKLNNSASPRYVPRAFPGEKQALARAFCVKYDQNYGLWGSGVEYTEEYTSGVGGGGLLTWSKSRI
jgi:hypothetical protein